MSYNDHDFDVWVESALMKGEIKPAHFRTIHNVDDVPAFGLTWEDCEQLLMQLGYSARVSIGAR